MSQDLKARVLKAAEFEYEDALKRSRELRFDEESDFPPKDHTSPSSFIYGAQSEYWKLFPLIKALADCADALKDAKCQTWEITRVIDGVTLSGTTHFENCRKCITLKQLEALIEVVPDDSGKVE